MKKEFMDLAFDYAKIAFDEGEIPIGAVIVKNDIVVGFGYNKKEHDRCAISHAEILAIKMASHNLNNWRLNDCDLYVTLDPCPMCASAIKQSRIKNVYSACSNSYINNNLILNLIFESDITNSKVNFYSNLNVDNSKKILNSFFNIQRNK